MFPFQTRCVFGFIGMIAVVILFSPATVWASDSPAGEMTVGPGGTAQLSPPTDTMNLDDSTPPDQPPKPVPDDIRAASEGQAPAVVSPESRAQDTDGAWSQRSASPDAAQVYDVYGPWRVSGALGIGTDVPAFNVDVNGNTNGVARVRVQNTNTGGSAWADVAISTGQSKGYAIQKFGPNFSAFTWSGQSLADWARFRSDSGVNGLIFTTGGPGPLVFGTSDVERMRITGDGAVVIDNTTDGHALRLWGPYGPFKHGARLNFGDSDLVYLEEDLDDNLTIYSSRTALMGGWVGIGTQTPQARLDVNGTTRTQVLQITGGADVAEMFTVSGNADVLPGMVVALDSDTPGTLRIADRAYDRAVVGVISNAGGIEHGLLLHQENTIAAGEVPVALVGRVYVWADAGYSAIQPGDLLTTSGTPGHAMKVTDHARAQGAILGKAMTELEAGRGLVLVLVALQ